MRGSDAEDSALQPASRRKTPVNIYLRRQFPLFSSHLDLAHHYWQRLLCPDDMALDATCGQGYDSLFLASLGLKKLFIFDIQKKALEMTRAKLQNCTTELSFHELCHSKIGDVIPQDSLTLIVYNLGYLPGSDKQVKTVPKTTLESVQTALNLLKAGGVISITCYPGHEEGALEETELLSFSKALSPTSWNVCHHSFLNRKASPSLLLIQKQK